MDFDLNRNEKLLKESAREFFQKEFSTDMVREMEEDPKGYISDLWAKMAELGYTGLLLTEEFGGMEGTSLGQLWCACQLLSKRTKSRGNQYGHCSLRQKGPRY